MTIAGKRVAGGRRAPACVAAAVALAGLGVSRAALGDVIDECVDASDLGQVARDRGQLLAARELFLKCARDQCPAPVQRDCAVWLADTESRLPSVVFRARDRAGRDLVDVTVYLDGKKLLERLDGRARAVDPGAHELRWEHRGSPAVAQRFLVAEGDKGRLLKARIGPETPKPDSRPPAVPPVLRPERRRAGVPAASLVLGGVGLVGLAGFGYFGLTARRDREELRDRCAPDCRESEVDGVRRRVIAANVSLGIGMVALGSALFWALTEREAVAPQARRAAKPSARLGVLPTREGAIGVVGLRL